MNSMPESTRAINSRLLAISFAIMSLSTARQRAFPSTSVASSHP
jgi:hypothetical protein